MGLPEPAGGVGLSVGFVGLPEPAGGVGLSVGFLGLPEPPGVTYSQPGPVFPVVDPPVVPVVPPGVFDGVVGVAVPPVVPTATPVPKAAALIILPRRPSAFIFDIDFFNRFDFLK